MSGFSSEINLLGPTDRPTLPSVTKDLNRRTIRDRARSRFERGLRIVVVVKSVGDRVARIDRTGLALRGPGEGDCQFRGVR